jgi:hypothetical protein
MPKKWEIFIEDDNTPHLVISDNGVQRVPTMEECERAVSILGEEGSSVIRLHCRNTECPDKGKGWIERSRIDASKNMYHCDVCGKPMER